MSEHKRKARKLWFRAKEYGWGWYPSAWQGWALTVLFSLLYTFSFLVFFAWMGAAAKSGAGSRDVIFGVLEFLVAIALLTYALVRICTRFGEAPRWRWGKD